MKPHRNPARLGRDFFRQDTLQAARTLLGARIVREWEGRRLECAITETEAYIGRIDKACHAYGCKRTPRTQTLYASPGTAYVYLIYGMYHCLNFVTEPENEPAAVLIRGAVPLAGEEEMARARFGKSLSDLSRNQKKNFLNGPGKLCQALHITRQENEMDLTESGTLYVLPGRISGEIQTGPRIGIDYAEEAADFPWRFWVEPDQVT